MAEPFEIVIGDRSTIARKLAEGVRAAVEEAASASRPCSVAVTGGSLATEWLPYLAVPERPESVPIDWSRVHVFWGDERAVPPTHSESNFGGARAALLAAGVPPDQLHRMPADERPLDDAAQRYQAELHRLLGTPPVLDVILLGVGPDGHICSLFPEHPLLQEAERDVAPIADSPKPPPERLTLTMPMITRSRRVLVAVFSRDKAGMVRKVVRDGADLPVRRALVASPNATLLLDHEAAGKLD